MRRSVSVVTQVLDLLRRDAEITRGEAILHLVAIVQGPVREYAPRVLSIPDLMQQRDRVKPLLQSEGSSVRGRWSGATVTLPHQGAVAALLEQLERRLEKVHK
jgi:hypothetical protein